MARALARTALRAALVPVPTLMLGLGILLHGGVVAAAGVAGDAPAPAPGPATASGPEHVSRPLTLGMAYIVPPHVPGSKVRTPEGLAPLLAERVGRQLPLRELAVHTDTARAGASDASDAQQADVLLLALDAQEAGHAQGMVIPTGYRAGIMAIMRTDTDIHRWEDLRGRTVCLAEGSGLAGHMQARYGAIEKVLRAPADALLDLRIGGCDATVHDSTMLDALLEFPEWRKFSARLPIQQERDLVFILPDDDPALARTLQAQVREWREAGLLAKLTAQAARDIAFEVYMDQEVPDCH